MIRILLFFILVFLFSCNENEVITPSTSLGDKIGPLFLTTDKNFKIAVVGSGIGGSSFVHFLNKAVSSNVQITVFEKENRIGGRVKKDSLGGGMIEQGATLIHSSNYYLQDIMDKYRLQKAKPHGGEGEAETLAIWDGNEFRLNTSRHSFRSTIQMLWAYGMSLSDLADLVKSMIPKWEQVYYNLDAGTTYNTPDELFKDIGLYELTQQSSYDYFKKEGIRDELIYEFVDCISRVNYHQDGNINAFTDMVSLAGAGLDGGELFSVEGGNDLMIQSILSDKPNVDLRLNHKVTHLNKLTENNKSQYEIIIDTNIRDTFDIVVIACPLDLANIALPDYNVKMDRAYQTVHANFIAGEIDYTYFNKVENAPQTIFTIENEEIPFVSIAKTSHAPDWDLPIYKVFSRKALDDTFIDQVFENRKGRVHQEWKAYTVLSPMKEWPPFKIDDGLFYINAMESAVSAMETEAIAARNVTNLTFDFIRKYQQKHDVKNLGIGTNSMFNQKLGIEAVPQSLGKEFTANFNRYTKVMAANGKPIHIVIQSDITQEQIIRCRSILEHFLKDYPGSEFGSDKSAIANKMADNQAVLAILNGQDDGENQTEVNAQYLFQNEIQVEGHPWYTNQNYNYRDAAFEEILHFVHDNGIGVDGPNTRPGAAPKLQNVIRAAQINGLDNKLWADDKRAKDWIKELTEENSLSQEYLASVIDTYYGLWGAWDGNSRRGEVGESDKGMWGLYVAKTRDQLESRDPMAYELMTNKFFHPYLTYDARIDSNFSGTFSLQFDVSIPYTHHSRYLKDITLLGNNNTDVRINELNNEITGNFGMNTVIFSGSSDEYAIETNDGTTTILDNIKGRDSLNIVRQVERLQFSDKIVVL